MADGKLRGEYFRWSMLVAKVHNMHIARREDAMDAADIDPYQRAAREAAMESVTPTEGVRRLANMIGAKEKKKGNMNRQDAKNAKNAKSTGKKDSPKVKNV